MKKLFSVFILLSALFILAFICLPVSVLRTDAAQNPPKKSLTEIQQKNKFSLYRVYLGDSSLQASGSGLYFTVYVSYNPSTNVAQIDGVNDSSGNPVTITSTSWTGINWDTTTNPYQLTLMNLRIDFT